MLRAAAVGLGLALAGAAAAQPFQVVSDGGDGIWVLDGGSGAVSWCRLVAQAGAKVVDVYGVGAEVREAPARPSRPTCELVRAGNGTNGPPFDLAAFFADPEGWGWTGGAERPWESRGDVGAVRER